jgi:hypothetical protein
MDVNDYIGFVYLWTNIITGKKYIGAHVGKVDDGYIGSGKYFRKSIDKYGLENFERKILHFEYDSVENLWKKEFELINENNAVKSNEYYNLCNTSPKMMKYIDGKIEKIVTQETKHKLSEIAKNRKPPSEKTREKMATNSHIRGKKWYNDGTESKVFFVGNEPNGWKLGRIKTSNGNKGYKTHNNGSEEKQFKENQVPDGWIKGRLKKNILSGSKNGFYGKKHSKNSIKKIIETKNKNQTIFYGGRNPASVRIKINNKIYSTIKEAIKDTGLKYSMIKKLGEEIL